MESSLAEVNIDIVGLVRDLKYCSDVYANEDDLGGDQSALGYCIEKGKWLN